MNESLRYTTTHDEILSLSKAYNELKVFSRRDVDYDSLYKELMKVVYENCDRDDIDEYFGKEAWSTMDALYGKHYNEQIEPGKTLSDADFYEYFELFLITYFYPSIINVSIFSKSSDTYLNN